MKRYSYLFKRSNEVVNNKNQFYVQGLINRPTRRQWSRILFLSVMIGILGGLSAIILKITIDFFIHFFFQFLLPHLSIYIGEFNIGYIILPVLGACVISPILSRWSKNTIGGGVGKVLESVTYKRSDFKAKDWFFKLFGSSITIGSGGSGGPEGPIIQMNASIGGFIGGIFHLTPNEKRILVACGVSSGISAFFNAPLGGTIFAIELLVPSLEFFVTVPVFFAGILGGFIGKLFINPEILFLENSSLLSYQADEFIYFIILGVLCGVLAYLWLKIFTLIQKKFNEFKINDILKPILGAVLIGVVLMLFPNKGLNGDGISFIDFDQLILEHWWILFLLGIGKMITTSITIGSGGSAGMFAPGLYIGAMFGGSFALIMNILFPSSIHNEYLYFILGMGAFFAAASQEPIGILLIIAEMVSNIVIILPLMICITLAFVVDWMLTEGKLIYTIKQELNNKPIRTDTITHFLNATIDEYTQRNFKILEINNEKYKGMKILDFNEILLIISNDDNKVMGFINSKDFTRNRSKEENSEDLKHLVNINVVKLVTYTKVLDAIDIMDENQIDWLLVVHPDFPDQFYGILYKEDILKNT